MPYANLFIFLLYCYSCFVGWAIDELKDIMFVSLGYSALDVETDNSLL